MSVEDLKTCTTCSQELPLDQFYWQTSRSGKRYPRGKCKSCEYVQGRQRIKGDPDSPERLRFNHIKHKYGLTRDRFHAILESQGGQCSICSTEVNINSCIDHDHQCCPGEKSCGECVRGILCRLCNQGLGQFRDNPTLLRQAAQYLE